MKKLFFLLVAVVLICTVSVTAFATFNIDPGESNYNNWTKAIGGDTDTIVADGLNLSWTSQGGFAWITVGGSGTTGSDWEVNLQDKTYTAFHVENTADYEFTMFLIMDLINAGGGIHEQVKLNDVRFINDDGTDPEISTSYNSDNRIYGVLPAGFSGWIVIPNTSKNLPNMEASATGNYEVADPSDWTDKGATVGTGFHLYQIQLLGAPSDDAPADSATVIKLSKFFHATSEVPTALDGPSSTADLSVIAYAVAALTGCGALVVAGKRK